MEKNDPNHSCRLFFKTDCKSDFADNNIQWELVKARHKLVKMILAEIYHLVMTKIVDRQKWVYYLDQSMRHRILLT